MKRLIIGLILAGITIACYGKAIIFSKPDGGITALEPSETTFTGNRILGASVYTVDWDITGLGSGTDVYNYVEIVTTDEATGEIVTNVERRVKGNISEVSDFYDVKGAWDTQQVYVTSVVADLKKQVLGLADAYGVTGRPLNWFTLKDTIKASAVTNAAAIEDATELNALALFLDKWGADLFNISE